MVEPIRNELSVQAERALLVAVILPGSTVDPLDPLGELRALTRTAGGIIADEIVAKRHVIHPGLYLGSGKAQQIADRAHQNEIDVVIFDNDLSPAQIRDLEEIIGCKVIDRSELILDIFAAHARTSESRLQVELAQLEYTYPRLRHMWTHLERTAGGQVASGGIGTRGPGEKQLETDRRLVQKRTQRLKQELQQIDRRKVREVRSRGEAFGICLVGYTNAGKSTLMNALTGAEVLVADKLFATLDTRTRQWDLDRGQTALLSDTVGFVRDLPHHLVASFRATLEEAIHANLLLHVADASNERLENEIAAVNKVLVDIGCADSRRILVLNKIDKIMDPIVHMVLNRKYPEAIKISAATGKGVERLIEEVRYRVTGGNVNVTLRANCGNGKLMHYIGRHADVQSQTYDGQTASITAVMPAVRLEGLEEFGDDVEIVNSSNGDR
ncbi:MAG: GTPase HflX [Planctomycetaceae bacterium]|nr:GTPase HflX [Planctomycetaceae bacterium]